jgi:hypothetical protein
MFVYFIIIIILYLFYHYTNNIETFTNATQEIVIARYNESLDWINEEPFNRHPIIIYNKSDNNNFVKSPNIKKVVNLPNVGREMHSYFYHIITNYDKLADVTIFLPGSADLSHKFQRSKDVVYKVEETNSTVLSCINDDNFVENNYNFEIDNYLSTHEKNKDINTDTNMKVSDIRPYGKWFDNIFDSNEQNKCISFNSIIAISRDNILQKPKSYYEKLNKQVDSHQNPETVHYIERSWYAVFYPYDKNASFI